MAPVVISMTIAIIVPILIMSSVITIAATVMVMDKTTRQ
jgi:hypothetical protein